MKTAPLVICLVTALPALAEAQPQFDGTFQLQYAEQPDEGDYQNTELSTSISHTYASGLGVQVDGFYLRYANYPDDDIYGAALHMTYDVKPNVAVGLFYNRVNWEGSDWSGYGLEATFNAGDLQVDGIVAIEHDIDDDTDYPYGALFAEYNVNDWFTLGAGLGKYDDYEMTTTVSLSKSFNHGFNVSVSALDTQDEGFLYAVALSMDIGSGAKFRRPDYAALFNVW